MSSDRLHRIADGDVHIHVAPLVWKLLRAFYHVYEAWIISNWTKEKRSDKCVTTTRYISGRLRKWHHVTKGCEPLQEVNSSKKSQFLFKAASTRSFIRSVNFLGQKNANFHGFIAGVMPPSDHAHCLVISDIDVITVFSLQWTQDNSRKPREHAFLNEKVSGTSAKHVTRAWYAIFRIHCPGGVAHISVTVTVSNRLIPTGTSYDMLGGANAALLIIDKWQAEKRRCSTSKFPLKKHLRLQSLRETAQNIDLSRGICSKNRFAHK